MMENILDISLCVIQSRVYNNNIVHILYGWKLKTKEKKNSGVCDDGGRSVMRVL